MVISVPFVLVIFFYVIAVNSQGYAQGAIILSRCFSISPLIDPICVTVTNDNCMILTADVKIGDKNMIGPTTVPIVELLNNVQSQIDTIGTNKADYCQESKISDQDCKICGHFNNISIHRNVLNACGNLTIQCGPFGDKFELGCLQVKNCSLLSCGGNDCSDGRGVCTNLGLCQCRGDNTGLDCGLVVEKNCISGQALVSGDICLENAKIQNCGNEKTMEVSLTIDGKQNLQKMNVLPVMDQGLEECQKSFKTSCEICPHALFQILDSKNVQTCPYIKLVCADVEQATYNFSCFSVPAVAEDCVVDLESDSIKGISIFISCMVILTLLGLIFALYKGRKFIHEKLSGHRNPVFMSAFGDVSEDRNHHDLDDDLVDMDVDESALGVVNKELDVNGEDSDIEKVKDD